MFSQVSVCLRGGDFSLVPGPLGGVYLGGASMSRESVCSRGWAATTCTVGKRVVRILLESFLVSIDLYLSLYLSQCRVV